MNKSNLLIQEPPLQVLPRLATEIGLNEAIILQQIHYWLEINRKASKNYEDGYTWTYNSYEVWQEENFPFWSVSTIKRSFGKLRNMGLIRAEQRRKSTYDRRVWVTIDYEKLVKLEHEIAGEDYRECQNDTVADSNMTQSTYTETTQRDIAPATADAPPPEERPTPPPEPAPTPEPEPTPSTTPDKPKSKAKKRDPMFDAIALYCWGIPVGGTVAPSVAPRIGKVKKELLTTYPDLTPEEFETAIKAYYAVNDWIAQVRDPGKVTQAVIEHKEGYSTNDSTPPPAPLIGVDGDIDLNAAREAMREKMGV